MLFKKLNSTNEIFQLHYKADKIHVIRIISPGLGRAGDKVEKTATFHLRNSGQLATIMDESVGKVASFYR